MSVAWLYDLNACVRPTGVTRHALAQAEELSRREDVALTTVTGRVEVPEGLEQWDAWSSRRRRTLPLSTRTMLRLWRVARGPAIEHFCGRVDWVYCPAEFYVPTRRARVAVTSHDVRQDLEAGKRRRALLRRVFRRADVVFSVSDFNTSYLFDAFPDCLGKTHAAPNAPEDLYFDDPPPIERAAARGDLGVPGGMPYLLSVANFQPRKNLVRLIRAAGRLPAVARGDLALVLVGSGSDEQTQHVREAIAQLPAKAIVRLPGYREGVRLRAAYAEAAALVFPSTCESFGIPAVEAMAQGCPVVLADSTALPEIGGAAGWYFDPLCEDDITATLTTLLDNPAEARRRAAMGRTIARRYRWSESCAGVVDALLRS
jgi:glycosyltransferase involved in cell wall biosynthesis